jgi:microcystin-dependent protein
MSDPYIGEIRMFGGSFPPSGWVFCSGQLMPISENDALFTLIGTTYGGDGQETFAIPNLQSRVPVHSGTGAGTTYVIGETGGVESVTLTTQQIPIHNHPMTTTATNQQLSPQNAMFATSTSVQAGVAGYQNNVTPAVALLPGAISPTGGSQPHDNIQPTLCVSYILSLFGIFPQQN